MANTKISALTALTGADLANDDAFAVVDTSVTTTKKITVAELKLGIMPAPGPIGATTPSTGAFTTLSTAGVLSVVGAAASGAFATIKGSTNFGFTFAVDAVGPPYTNLIYAGGGEQVALGVANVAYATVGNTGLAVTGTISATSIITPGTFTTGTRPAKTLGGIIFDTTLNKLLIGGVSAWEVVTSI